MTAQILRFPSKEAMHAYVRGEAGLPELVAGWEVRPHVQAFADAVVERWPDIGTIGTYPGHSPSLELALDIFPANRQQGDELAAWATEEIEHWSIDYVIWYQRIYNPEVAPYWRLMEDRHSDTQNHKDHNHFSFEPTGSAVPDDPRGGFLMALDDEQQEAVRREVHEAWEAIGWFQDEVKANVKRTNELDAKLAKILGKLNEIQTGELPDQLHGSVVIELTK